MKAENTATERAAGLLTRPAIPFTEAGGMVPVLRAEWTKFRTVRGWVIAMVTAALVTVLIGVWAGSAGQDQCGGGPGAGPAICRPSVPLGPGGEAVTDTFYLVRQPLPGHGSVTARVTSLTGAVGSDQLNGPVTAGLQPWSKAGIIVTASTRPGSAYAAIMVTGGHGVRMQGDFVDDVAGPAGRGLATSPRWLRLARSGNTVTGYDSADGTRWTRVGAIRLAGLPATAQAGLFVTSPEQVNATGGAPTQATGVFDHVSPPGPWSGDQIGGNDSSYPALPGRFRQAGGRFTVTGSGDIAPALPGPADGYVSPGHSLAGVFAALIVVTVVGTMFVTTEYRRGLIRVTLAATPGRGRVLAAKAIVIGSVAFVAGLAGAVAAIPVGGRLLRANGKFVLPVSTLTEARLVAGTAALLAVAAVLALALGVILRHGAGPVTAVIAVIVVPYFFAAPLGVLPAGAADWLLRVTPAAGFAVEQAIARYPQVANAYTPRYGYYPLAPWAGLAVFCAWTALALAGALILLRRRDV
jgi:ABC-type transport system involved in multi-copper enzyme maturation permease subunit